MSDPDNPTRSAPTRDPGPTPTTGAELLGILGRALIETSGVIDQGSRDLGHRFGPIWGELVDGLGTSGFHRKLDEIAGSLERFAVEARAQSAALRQDVERLRREGIQSPAVGSEDSIFALAQSEEFETRIARTVEQAIHRHLDPARSSPTGRNPADRARDRATAVPTPARETANPALASLRAELDAARTQLTEAEASSRRHQNEKVNYQSDLRSAREDLARWRVLTLGEDLAADLTCVSACDELVRDAIGGQAASTSLIGQWMSFRTAPADRLPIQMRQIGEAYYGWRPRTQPGPTDDDPLESALVRAIQTRCDRLGVRNKVEVIRPNARFDTSRHETEGGGGGIAVVEVRGWLVLKADGSVIYRAKVVSR